MNLDSTKSLSRLYKLSEKLSLVTGGTSTASVTDRTSVEYKKWTIMDLMDPMDGSHNPGDRLDLLRNHSSHIENLKLPFPKIFF